MAHSWRTQAQISAVIHKQAQHLNRAKLLSMLAKLLS